jgi:glycosyltransferase involved in cell wall biosynthesis
MRPLISIIIPQYKTFEVTRLCLRALKKFSKLDIEIIVVDNNSQDESVAYLKRNKWIKLIENHNAPIGGQGHKQALDIGIKAANGEWVLLFHSDTIVLTDGWDITLLELLNRYPNAVGASSTIREINKFLVWYKKGSRYIKEWHSYFHHKLDPTNDKIMSYCFILKRDFLMSINFNFESAEGDVADALYKTEIKEKHEFILMGRLFLDKLLWHTSNVSSIFTGQINDQKSVKKFQQKMQSLFSTNLVSNLVNDSTLDNFD